MIVVQSCIQSQAKQLRLIFREISYWFYSLTISAKPPSHMHNYTQKTPLIIYSTSYVRFCTIYRIYNYIVFLCGLQIQRCKKKCSKFCFKTLFSFFYKKICMCGFHQRLGQFSTKPRSLKNYLHILQGQLLMVQDLILALKANNVEAWFFI